MIDDLDELDELRAADPVAGRDLGPAVAIDRRTLIDLLEADGGRPGGHRDGRESRRRLSVVRGRPSRSSTRLGYAGAVVAAAAALAVVAMIGAGGSSTDGQMTDPAADRGQVTPADDAGTTGTTAPAVVVLVPEAEDGATDEGGIAAGSSTAAVANGESTEADGAGSDGTEATPSTVADGSAPPAEPGENSAAPEPPGPFDRTTDLLALHYDHAHRDDGHATMAARELATWFDLEPLVVAGTSAAGFAGPIPPYAEMMRAAWGDAWLDAHVERPTAVTASVERWLMTLDAGGQIWVADGGVSDFTAEVVAEIRRLRPLLDTRAVVHVVQHNTKNQTLTLDGSLEALRETTDYQRIDDGNLVNDTADLQRPSERFVTAALAGRHGDGWAAAFDYLAADSLDFSDTVEVLHILGIGRDVVADPDDFAARFLD